DGKENVHVRLLAEDIPLHYAAQKGHVGILNALLQNGANANVVNSKKQTPLYMAVSCENLESTKILLKTGGKINSAGENLQITFL
ncbi:hypothetical protein HK100_001110, partial [Physocladia obscura]